MKEKKIIKPVSITDSEKKLYKKLLCDNIFSFMGNRTFFEKPILVEI